MKHEMRDRPSAEVLDRAAGVLLVSACGDALGAAYEFTPPERIPATIGIEGGGSFGWEKGEWTDDSSMAWVIAQVASKGVDLRSSDAQDQITAGWYSWLDEAKDVGAQTQTVFIEAAADSQSGVPAAADMRGAARRYHRQVGRSAGNGSLMRTAPVALAYLDNPGGLVEAATQISALTHYDPEAGEACVLQCHAVRHAVLTGDLDLRVGLGSLEGPRAALWASRIDEAEGLRPESYRRNVWVVEALLGAWSAIAGSSVPDDEQAERVSAGEHLVAALEAAVRGGHDTDTVAAIAGALLGAKHGTSGVPEEWHQILHGWPGKRAGDLILTGHLIAAGGGRDADR